MNDGGNVSGTDGGTVASIKSDATSSGDASSGGMIGGGLPISAGLIDRSGFSNINGDDSVNVTGSAAPAGSHSLANNRSDQTDRNDATDDSADTITVALVQRDAADQPGAISVSVPHKIATSGKAFSFPIPAEVVAAAGGDKLKAAGMDGKRLPTWLKYSIGSNTFSATKLPAGALPMKVLVSTGSRRWTMVITERTGH